jgi:predicted transcriptional regulator
MRGETILEPRVAQVWAAVHVGGARSVRAVAQMLGLSISNTHRYVRLCREAGLVAFEDGQKGTLRSAVTVVMRCR